ncbi:MAG: cell wall hydrolase [Candidatus Competibacteraceae bacterium]|nr:cell wall hydrolase [Candidatus Competibacteraceae bacterium]
MTASFQICAKDTMPKLNKHSPFDIDTMALTVWAEARGELRMGQRAVAWVIRNRYENPGWWSRNRNDGIQDDTIAAVCRDPWQFSCWNKSDPQSKILHDPDTLKRNNVKTIRTLCESVLERGLADDVSKGADHYCTVKVIPKTKWAKGTPGYRNREPRFFLK